MAYYDNDTQPERATPYPNGGCLSGLLVPLAVIAVSIVVFSTLSSFVTVPSTVSASSTVAIGAGGSQESFISPYDSYTLTQGPHGFSYGHMAIDIAAGKGATIYSPINGTVDELYIDGIGNPTLVLENDVYRVTLLHGIYTVEIGQQVVAGQIVGTESNQGNTTDMQGNSCRNRDCGYHTHLNVFDKRSGTNINPLDLLEKANGN
jgi:murein DD-endopeptidase MepM/ murein hydrolase activator NlpD